MSSATMTATDATPNTAAADAPRPAMTLAETGEELKRWCDANLR